MTAHVLKTIQPHFDELAAGRKTFELRRDDRGFAVGDRLELAEWDTETLSHTGRLILANVTHILRDFPGIEDGYCIMSLSSVVSF
jgi:hypothetical protein